MLRSRGFLLIIAVIFLALTAASLVGIYESRKAHYEKTFGEHCDQRVQRLSREFDATAGTLPPTAAAISGRPAVTSEEWLSLVDGLPLAAKPMEALRLVYVSGGDRAAYEASLGSPIRDVFNSSKRAADAPEYLVSELSKNPVNLYLDLLSHTFLSESLLAVRRTGVPMRVLLPSRLDPEILQFAVAASTYKTLTAPSATSTAEERGNATTGAAMMLFDPRAILTSALGDSEDVQVSLRVRDYMIVGHNKVKDVTLASLGDSLDVSEEYAVERSFSVDALRLVVRFTPAASDVNSALWDATILAPVCAAVLFVGALMVLFFWLFQRRLRSDVSESTALESRNQFVRFLAKQLRGPINSLLTSLDALKASSPNHEQKKELLNFEIVLRTLSASVNDMLELETFLGGTPRLHCVEVDLAERLRVLVNMHRHAAQARGLQLMVQALGWVPRRIYADPHRLLQILSNLVSNSIKFSDTGSVILQIQAKPAQRSAKLKSLFVLSPDAPSAEDTALLELPSDAPSVVFAPRRDYNWLHSSEAKVPGDAQVLELEFIVSDTGRGIPAKALPSLFQPFVDRRNTGKSGLGLAFTRALVTAWGGQLIARSVEGRGTVVVVRLPMWVAGDDAVIEPEHFTDVENIIMPLVPIARLLASSRETATRRLSRAGSESANVTVLVEPLRLPGEVEMIGSTRGAGAGAGQGGSPALLAAPRVGSGRKSKQNKRSPSTLRTLFRGQTVLLCDSDPERLQKTQSIIESLGPKVYTVTSGAEALQRLSASAIFQMLLVAQDMELMSGRQVVAELRRQGNATPAVLVGGRLSAQEKAQCAEEGVNAHLKDVNEETLIMVFSRFMAPRALAS